MNRRSVELRLQTLRVERAVLDEKIQEARDNGVAEAEIEKMLAQLPILEGRIAERNDELEAEKDRPRYGDPVRVKGMWSIKVPVVGSVEEANKLLALRGTESPQRVWAGREYREKEATQATVSAMDGRSPFIPEEERKPGNSTL